MVLTEHFYFNIYSNALNMLNALCLAYFDVLGCDGAQKSCLCVKISSFSSTNLFTVFDKDPFW